MVSANILQRKGIKKIEGNIDKLVGLKDDLQRVLLSLGIDPEYDKKNLTSKIGQLTQIIDGLIWEKSHGEEDLFSLEHEELLSGFNKKMRGIAETE